MEEGVAVRLYQAGFQDLVSVMPPDAQIAESSRINPSQRGKVPGLEGNSGWYGFAWDHDITLSDAAKMDSWGANIGIRGRRFPGLDVDVEDRELTRIVVELAVFHFGPAPVRFSREPRRLLMYHADEPFPRTALVLTKDGVSHTVELLGDGRQYLIHGVHPSGSRYSWMDFPDSPMLLTTITEEQVGNFFDSLTLACPDYETEMVGAGRAVGLRDVPDRIAKGGRNDTLTSIAGTFRQRNLSELVATNALLTINEEQCDPGLDASEVRRIVESVYVNYAAGPAHEVRTKAEDEFKADPKAKPFEPDMLSQMKTSDEIIARKFPDEEWLVHELIPMEGVSCIISKPKVGKSTLARALAVAVSEGEPWFGRRTVQGTVAYLLLQGEGTERELTSELTKLGADGTPIHWFEGSMPEHPYPQIERILLALKPTVLIVDTLQKLARVDNLNSYAMVQRAMDPIHELAKHCCLIFLHHAKKGEVKDFGDMALGSIMLYGSVESMIGLRRDPRDRLIRTLAAEGRSGIYLEEHLWTINAETHVPIFGEVARLRQEENQENAILASLIADGQPVEKSHTVLSNRGKNGRLAAMRRLEEKGTIVSRGSGRSGDGRYYCLADPTDDFFTAEETEDE